MCMDSPTISADGNVHPRVIKRTLNNDLAEVFGDNIPGKISCGFL